MSSRVHSSFPNRASTSKMVDAVHYIVANMPVGQLGSTKLNKVLWEADVLHYRLTGESVTGEKAYTKLQHGPVPKGILGAIYVLVNQQKIVCRERKSGDGIRRDFRKLVDPDVSTFTPAEVQSLEKAIAKLSYMSASEASERTHDALWRSTPMKKDILIAAAAIEAVKPSDRTMRWAQGIVSSLPIVDDFCEA